jgi:MoxR-like ATPase
VLATQNPIEYEGTYPLPEAQLDRFLLRVGIGYPTPDDEWRVLEARVERRSDEVGLDAIVDGPTLIRMQRALEFVHVSEAIGRYLVDLVTATRESSRVQVGASPRGTLALLKLSRARAALAGRDFVVPEDVKYVAVPALAHRITLRPEMWLRRIDPATIVEELVERTPAPASGAVPTYAGAHLSPRQPTASAHAAVPTADPHRYSAPPRG